MAAGKRSPFVALRTDVRKEERVRFIADLAGYNEFEALGRLASMWCWCTDRGLEDAPEDCDGYAVPEAVVRRFLGARGVEAILGDGCDELAMGARRTDGLIYLRGTSDTVLRLRTARASARDGGLARAEDAKRGERGQFVGKPTNDQRPAGEQLDGGLDEHQLSPAVTPAATSEIPDPTNHKPQREEDPSASLRSPTETKAPRKEPRKESDSDHAKAVAAFDRRYQAKYGAPPTWGGRQGKSIARLLKALGLPELERRIAILFDAPPEFLSRSPPDVATLEQHIDKLSQPSRPGQSFRSNQHATLELQLERVAMLEREEFEQKAAGQQ